MNRRHFFAWALGIATAAVALDPSIVPVFGKGATPARFLIPNVPFLGFEEAAKLSYADKNIVNPSGPAADGMLLRFTGQDLALLQKSGPDLEAVGWKMKVASGLDDIKPLIAHGVPVKVIQMRTPMAHIVNPPWVAMLNFSKSALLAGMDSRNFSTGILGRMASYETFEKMQKELKVESLEMVVSESVYNAMRVVIGYDDDTKTVTLHDPSFGPACEVSYADFEALWGPCGRRYLYLEPREKPGAGDASPYRERTADEKAAQWFLYGYASSCLGDIGSADKYFARALAIPGLSKGYEHLVRLELASLRHHEGRLDDAVAEAQRAIALSADNPLAWAVMSHICNDRKQDGDDKLAQDAARKVQRLQKDKKAMTALARFLPHNVSIPLVGAIRGWAGEKLD